MKTLNLNVWSSRLNPCVQYLLAHSTEYGLLITYYIFSNVSRLARPDFFILARANREKVWPIASLDTLLTYNTWLKVCTMSYCVNLAKSCFYFTFFFDKKMSNVKVSLTKLMWHLSLAELSPHFQVNFSQEEKSFIFEFF